MRNVEYYSVEDLAQYYNVSNSRIKEFIKDGTIKTLNKGNQYMLIPKKIFNKQTKGYLDWVLRNSKEQKVIKLSKIDTIRRLLIEVIIFIIIPIITMVIYRGLLGNFVYTELGSYIMIGLIILSTLFAYLGYKILFQKYSDDLPEPFF